MGKKVSKASKKKKKRLIRKITNGIGLFLCIVFGLLLACNLVIIVRGELNPEMPPSVFGVTPMATLSGSMSGTEEGHIEVGDLIFVGRTDAETLVAGDVISYMEGEIIVTHRIVEVQTNEEGEIEWITKGDANNTNDTRPVKASQLVGKYMFRIPKLGDFVLFMQKPMGMLMFIGVPVLAFIGYDIFRRQKAANRQKAKADKMKAELERLRSLAGEKADDAGDE